jgi:hypothetical protein
VEIFYLLVYVYIALCNWNYNTFTINEQV